MCDVESYIYMPMLEELGYVPSQRYAFGEEIRRHLEAVAEHFDLVDDALFHTGVTHAEWREEESRWLIHTDRGDAISCRWYVLAPGILNLMKLPAIKGMEDFAGHSFHTARWDYDYTGGGPDAPLDNLKDKTVALIGTGASGIQCLPPLAASAEQVYVFQRTPSAIGERGNRPTNDDFADTLEPGWQRARMDNFQAIMLGRSAEVDQIDDGWTQHYAIGEQPAAPEGHEPGRVHRECRGHRLRHHGRAPAPGGDAGRGPRDRRDPQALLPLHLQAALLPRRVPLGLQQPQRHPHRLPGRHGAHHRGRPGRERRRSTRSTASSTAPASSPSARPSTGGPATTSSGGAA